mmetsp:Transcript_72461/g.212602  ORF Transcript_72461/g.212602 Transcript_72461/m.212602 type:complete len:247 (-) Transcript_72461:89-829(-)
MVTGRPCTWGAMTNHARAMLQPGDGYSALASGLRSSHEVVDVVLAAIQVVHGHGGAVVLAADRLPLLLFPGVRGLHGGHAAARGAEDLRGSEPDHVGRLGDARDPIGYRVDAQPLAQLVAEVAAVVGDQVVAANGPFWLHQPDQAQNLQLLKPRGPHGDRVGVHVAFTGRRLAAEDPCSPRLGSVQRVAEAPFPAEDLHATVEGTHVQGREQTVDQAAPPGGAHVVDVDPHRLFATTSLLGGLLVM